MLIGEPTNSGRIIFRHIHPAGPRRTLETMNATPSTIGRADRYFVSEEQEHAVKFFIKSFDYEFPDRRPEELEAACEQAFHELGGVERRERLEARARELLLA